MASHSCKEFKTISFLTVKQYFYAALFQLGLNLKSCGTCCFTSPQLNEIKIDVTLTEDYIIAFTYREKKTTVVVCFFKLCF